MKRLTDKVRAIYPNSALVVISWSLHSYRGEFSNRDVVVWDLYIQGIGNREFKTFEELVAYVQSLVPIPADNPWMFNEVTKGWKV